ncbi:MAG: type II toxin-antitoxin system prevent-host-death family antitoxin [Anaerolineales bacterium]|nr:type II toxin-antitoxin system prevent-host-death family antitoxin [Chloroflexota bacterium]MBL6983163.1 type II toxin-antitoxin system prevent-host-death family antitoxin [Anaerolineales bacterium]
MEFIQTIPKTDLARKTRQVLQAVQRGQTTIVESHGQPEAAIIDIIDYRILRAILHYYSHRPEVNPDVELSGDSFATIEDPQDQFNLVLAYYLGQVISMGRCAELLDLPYIDLRMRFARLDVPVFVGPQNIEELEAELENVERWENEHNQSGSSR